MMMRLMSAIPFICGVVLVTLLRLADWPLLKATGTVLWAAAGFALLILRPERKVSPIHLGFFIFLTLAGVLIWTGPHYGGPVAGSYPAALLYGSLLLVAVVPPLIGRGYFTYYFAKKTTPEAVWSTDLFVAVNRRLNWFWALLFLLGLLSGLVPAVCGLTGPIGQVAFDAVIPLVLMLAVGLPVTIHYPIRAQRRAGVLPGDEPATEAAPPGGPHSARTCRELIEMMPLGFNPEAAGDLRAVYQFDITGGEDFTAHLEIADGRCTYHPGPADKPGVTVQAPADVWLAISRGEKDGQTAFMAGEYKVQGDLSLLMRLGALFQG